MSAWGLSYARTGCSLDHTERNKISSGTTTKEKLVSEFHVKNDIPCPHQAHSLLFIVRNFACLDKKLMKRSILSTHWDNKQFRKLNSKPKEGQSLQCVLE